jgi:hypothetical protein
MQAKITEFLRGLFAPTPVAIWVISTLVVSLSGPFGTFDALSYFARLFYWASVIGLSIVFGGICQLVCRGVFQQAEPIKQDIAAVIAMTIVFTPVLLALTVLLVPPYAASLPNVPTSMFYVAAISTTVFLIRRMVPGIEPLSYSGNPGSPSPPRLLRRLPPDFVGPVLRLSVDDHFVEVVTQTQTHRIRMRFADAVDEMAGVTGYCTHRSHWVTAAAIVGAEHNGGKVSLRLVNGDVVPVSRKYRCQLAEAGLV